MSEASTSAFARAAGLLARGQRRPLAGSATQRLRELTRRALRPYTGYQHHLDTAMLEAVGELDREAREAHRDQLERLEPLVEELVATAEALRTRIECVEKGLRADLYAVPFMDGAPFSQFSSPVGQVTGYRSLGRGEGASSPYASFEDLFRGPAERVTDLQRPYLPVVVGHQPVLDVGCGRGEFLALLASEAIAARGVDADPGMVQRCLAAGLPVVHGDAIEYLDGVDDASLGTVFCAQVIEHLPVEQLRRLLVLARQKLAPGGLFIAETVNPHSLPALKTFWVDLTHQHPIFPEVALAMCALAGFAPAYVFAPGYESFEAARFASTSYAVVATCPPPATQ